MRYGLPGIALLLLAAGPRQTAPSGPRVAIVSIAGGLNQTHAALVRRACDQIRVEKPALVIFEIDTPGGAGTLMSRIGEQMMSLAPIPTAAYIRPLAASELTGGAWSAGAYLAFCCKKIYMYPGTVIGAAAPVHLSPEGATAAGEKTVSGFRELFRARAEQNGYPPNLAVAMVDKDLEIFEVMVDGAKRFLTAGEIEKLKNEGKKFDVPVIPYDSKEKLLTLTDRQVVEAGIGKIAESRQAIYSDLGIASPVEQAIESSWSEDFVGFVTSGIIPFLLLVVGILGIWVEFKTPGFGAAGAIGIAAIALLLFGHYLAGLAQVMDIVLIVAGVGLIAVELLVLPGTGLFAIAGVLCFFAGLILSFQDFTLPDTAAAPWQTGILMASLGRVLTAFLTAGVGFVILLRYLPSVPFFNRVVLQTEIAGTAPAPATEALEGRQGHAVTPLRPGGKIEVDGQLHDVVSEGEFVATGEPVEILRIEGMRIVVGKLKR